VLHTNFEPTNDCHWLVIGSSSSCQAWQTSSFKSDNFSRFYTASLSTSEPSRA